MNIKILSPTRDWSFIEEDIKKATDLMSCHLSYKYFPVYNPLVQEYLPGKDGLSRVFLASLVKPYQNDGIVVLHVPNFPTRGAGGWFSYVNNKPVIQIYGQNTSRYSRDPNFEYWHSEIIVHEMLHYFYWNNNIEDKTHYWHYERGDLMGGINEINNKLKHRIVLLEQIIELSKKVLGLRKQIEEQADDLWVVHHSATPLSSTLPATIADREKLKYGGKTFYNAIMDSSGNITYYDAIDKTRETKDLCVLGDFTKEVPTIKQKEALKLFLQGKKYTTHKELAKKGLATPSECPGKLLEYLR